MNITGTISAAQRPVQGQSGNQSQLDYKMFLKLLVTEMQNQDPTAPMDSTEYVAQLASFSNVEQGVQLNSKLDLLLQQAELTQATSLIGKTVTSLDGTLSGVVDQVRITDDGIVAYLESGDEILIGSGVTISS